MRNRICKKGTGKNVNLLDLLAKKRELLPLTLIVAYFAVYSILFTRTFLSLYNISSIVLEWAVPMILAPGMAIVLISKEIDLSIGYNVMFSSMICGSMVVLGIPIPLAILLTIIIASIFGFIIGTLVSKIGVNSFIVTLAFGLMYYGMSTFIYGRMFTVVNNGISITKLPQQLTVIGRFQLIKGLNFQIPILYALVIFIIVTVIFSSTNIFKHYYYIGSNYQAAKLSGIRADSLKRLAFVYSSVLSSLCGIILVSRYGTCSSSVGIGMELQAITACVIGGVSFTGGKGKIWGAQIGALFMVCLYNGLRIASAASNIYNIIMGSILLASVIIDALLSRRKIIG